MLLANAPEMSEKAGKRTRSMLFAPMAVTSGSPGMHSYISARNGKTSRCRSPASESELLSEDLGQKRRVMLDV